MASITPQGHPPPHLRHPERHRVGELNSKACLRRGAGTPHFPPRGEQREGVQPPSTDGRRQSPSPPSGRPRALLALRGGLVSPVLAGARHRGEGVPDVPEDTKFSAPLMTSADHFIEL